MRVNLFVHLSEPQEILNIVMSFFSKGQKLSHDTFKMCKDEVL